MGFLDRLGAKAAPAEDMYDDEEFYDEEEYFDDSEVAELHPVATNDIARIVTVWVSSYRDVKDFAVEFRSGLPVILNLSDAADAERARIVDFALGLCFGLSGQFSRISEDVFLLTPHEVKLDSRGDDTTHDFS
ncbi:cell division inhibitor SepF [Arcanobacterium wilhelmae]|uniref:Cell division protein SepF n=1 Tax=Arcanobacterium wilhelmae TaxID=1803177 RepID=A0ABT9N962_9ACTO|nr:cell division protein SepF [Arcanobacterium wilhelmae]MDP9800244.1 cell division inhibitor SepF [Arcanobacterium wilhelmae]WFN89683.1 cell division protein SepF [Arcanobacterium wilhelmae]